MVGSLASLTQFQKIVRTQLFSEPPMEYIVPSERFILTSDPDYMELSGLNRNSTYIKIEHSKSGFELAQKLRKSGINFIRKIIVEFGWIYTNIPIQQIKFDFKQIWNLKHELF